MMKCLIIRGPQFDFEILSDTPKIITKKLCLNSSCSFHPLKKNVCNHRMELTRFDLQAFKPDSSGC
jgi:hypothetical protein